MPERPSPRWQRLVGLLTGEWCLWCAGNGWVGGASRVTRGIRARAACARHGRARHPIPACPLPRLSGGMPGLPCCSNSPAARPLARPSHPAHPCVAAWSISVCVYGARTRGLREPMPWEHPRQGRRSPDQYQTLRSHEINTLCPACLLTTGETTASGASTVHVTSWSECHIVRGRFVPQSPQVTARQRMWHAHPAAARHIMGASSCGGTRSCTGLGNILTRGAVSAANPWPTSHPPHLT
jgi:hypothetical protein